MRMCRVVTAPYVCVCICRNVVHTTHVKKEDTTEINNKVICTTIYLLHCIPTCTLYIYENVDNYKFSISLLRTNECSHLNTHAVYILQNIQNLSLLCAIESISRDAYSAHI